MSAIALVAPRVGPSGRDLLELLALCPCMPTRWVNVMLGHRNLASTRQLLARLAAARLVACDQAGRQGRVWSLAGPQSQADGITLGLADTRTAVPLWPRRTSATRRVQPTPATMTSYRALAAAAAASASPTRPVLVAWEQPWRRRLELPSGRRVWVRMPAAALLRLGDESRSLLLLPDPGTRPVASHAVSLR
jgi:hypothetical protein